MTNIQSQAYFYHFKVNGFTDIIILQILDCDVTDATQRTTDNIDNDFMNYEIDLIFDMSHILRFQ